MRRTKWHSLPALPTLLIVAAAAVLLGLSLDGTHGGLACISYPFSTYALIVGVSGFVRLCRRAGERLRASRLMGRLHENPHLARYLDDALYRAEINLYFGTAVNALYIFIKLFSGILLRSQWLITFALYYFVLTVLRAFLVSYVRRKSWKQDLPAEYRRCRLAGILLLGLNAALTGILSRMIGHDDAYDYPGVLIYAIDAYTFYAVIVAVAGVFRFRRHGSPVLTAVKAVNLSAALVALLSLEAAMLQHFGPGGDSLFRHRMLGITGLGASLILLAISAAMIAHPTMKLRQMGENPNE